MCRTGHISRKGEVGCAQGAKMPACPFGQRRGTGKFVLVVRLIVLLVRFYVRNQKGAPV
jgi:hypothetical protein